MKHMLQLTLGAFDLKTVVTTVWLLARCFAMLIKSGVQPPLSNLVVKKSYILV